MEFVREMLIPRRFNTFSYFVDMVWITCGVILLGVFAEMEANESSSLICDITGENKEYTQGQCFDEFHARYSGGLPFFSFVIINALLVASTSVIYSQFVKSRIEELDQTADVETQRYSVSSKRLFVAYCCQLGLKLALGILFIILQTQVLYPSSFPSRYTCTIVRSQPTVGHQILGNSSSRNGTQKYECHTSQAVKKAFWASALCLVNGLFAFFVSVEMIYILVKAKVCRRFVEDVDFFAKHLLGHKDKPLPFKLFVENMKKRILRDTEKLQPLIRDSPRENGESRAIKIEEIFTTLVIHPDRKNYKFWGDRHEIFQEYLGQETACDQIRLHHVREIFSPEQDISTERPHQILIIGRPGVGKTLLCQKIIRDWAKNTLFDDRKNRENAGFDFAVLLKFRWFNPMSKLTLQEAISHSTYSGKVTNEIISYICQNTEKILLIFDGLDELKDRSNIRDEEDYSDSITEAMPFSALYGKIAARKLLPDATVITTTRATALQSIAHFSFEKVAEILGFTPEQVEEYVQRFVNDDQHAGSRIWQHIVCNANLLSLCYIPANCFIVCSYLRELLKIRCDRIGSAKEATLPTTLTEIYEGVVKMLIWKHNPEYKARYLAQDESSTEGFTGDVQETLVRLGELALTGTKEGKLIFDSHEIQGLEESGLIHRLPNQQIAPFTYQAQFCFVHLTIQEFFAAKELIRSTSPQELRRFVSCHIDEGHWQLVMQFLAGMFRSANHQPSIEIFTDLLPTACETRAGEGKLTWWPISTEKELALTLCRCIFEYHDMPSTISQRIAQIEQKGINLSMLSLYSTDCAAIVHVLKKVRNIPWIDLSFNCFSAVACREIAKLLEAGNICRLSSICNNITDEGVRHLSMALGQTKCKLKWLNLSMNNITDPGVKDLCDVLSKPECELTELVLDTVGVTEVGIQYIADTLAKEGCRLTALYLCANDITEVGAKYLFDAISQNKCELTKLHLGTNRIGDLGVKHLSGALSRERCKLTKVYLSDNEISDSGVKYLSDAAAQSQWKLVKMTLARNTITDLGVKYLCNALSQSGCNITSLKLGFNQITDKGVMHIADVLAKPWSKLTKLDLGGNQITDAGATYLSRTLRHGNGTLAKVNLDGNPLSKDVELEVVLAISDCRRLSDF